MLMIQWSAMLAPKLVALAPGDVIFVSLDHVDKTRAEALAVPAPET